MKILFVDVETTGLKPEVDQVVEIGLLFWDTESGRTFEKHTLVKHPEYKASDAYALGMHGKLFKEIATGKNEAGNVVNVVDVCDLPDWFEEAIDIIGPVDKDNLEKFTLSGKNVGSFDLQFLKRLPGWPAKRFRHRILDIGSLFFNPRDKELPDLNKCAELVGLPKQTSHRALDDCRMCLDVVKVWIDIHKDRSGKAFKDNFSH
jgi:oligoribonuclease